MINKTKIRRLLTGGVAVTTVLALSVPPAGAAVEAPDIFAGNSAAQALNLEITGPSGLLEPLGALGSLTSTANVSTLQQGISLTSNRINSDGLISAVTKLLQGLLNEGHHESTEEKSTFEDSIVGESLLGGALEIGAGNIRTVTDRAQNLTRSSSELLKLRVSLAPLLGDGGLLDGTAIDGTLDDALDLLLGAEGETDEGGESTGTEGVLGDLMGQLDGTLTQIENVVNESADTGNAVDLPAVDDLDLAGIRDHLDIREVDLLNVRKMYSDSEVITKDGVITSEAISGLVGAELLGGLVEVPAFEYSSIAGTAGKPGTAFADTKVKVIAVKVDGSDVISVSGDELKVGDQVLDLSGVAGAEGLLEDVENTLMQILNAVGLSLNQGEGTTRVADDGSSAFASVSALTLSLKPLHALSETAGVDDTLSSLGVQLAILGNNAGVSAAQVEAKPAVKPEEKQPSLPRTGGGAAAVLLGMLALGGAGALRRRS